MMTSGGSMMTFGMIPFDQEDTNFGYQSYLNLNELDDGLSPAENTAQTWSREAAAQQETNLPIDNQFVNEVQGVAETQTEDVLSQAGKFRDPNVREYVGDSRSRYQRARDILESNGQQISGNQYLAMTGRIDARAKPAQADLDRKAFADSFFDARRQDSTNPNAWADPNTFTPSTAATDGLNVMIDRQNKSTIY